jgi:hypothetical protein
MFLAQQANLFARAAANSWWSWHTKQHLLRPCPSGFIMVVLIFLSFLT